MPVCKSPQLVFVAAALSFALVSAGSAAEPDTSSWLCERCIGASGWELDIEAGPAWVADDVYRFGDYSGLDEKGTYLFGDFIGSYRDDDANYFSFEGYTRSKDATALFVKGGKQSLYELRASYQAIPRRIFATTATPYGGTGTSNLTLPTSWVRAPTTGQMTALADTLQPINIGWDWNIYGLGFDIKPGERWQFTTDYTRREREGVSRSAGAFYFDAVEFAAPVKYTTDDLEMALSYNSDNWQTSMRYFGSVFKNDNSSLTFANPYLAISGADTGQLALPPGNESHQLSLAGSLLLPARTTLTGQLSLGHLTQNADLLPYTTNPSLAGGTLPVASAGTEADTVNINIRAVTTPVSDWTFEGELRYNDFNNKTDINEYNYIVTDVIPAANAVNNTAYDYTRRDIKLRAEYRAFRSTKFLGGFDTERMERNRQDRSRTTTNRLWFRMRTRLAANADLDVDLFAEDRNGSVYEPVAKPGAAENPLMRKYNMADRQRNGIKLRGSVYPGERSDLGWEFEYGRDDYRTSEIGLEESSYVRFGGDFAYLLTDSATAYASLYNERIDTEQRNSQSFSTPDWAATTSDNFTTATLGATWPELIGKLDANFEYLWADSEGRTRNDTSGLPTAFPDLKSKRQNLKLGVSYPYSESLSVGIDYIYEKYSSSDWALDDVGPATIPNLLALGADAWNYDNSVVYVNVRYQLQAN